MSPEPNEAEGEPLWRELLGSNVVIDTDSTYIYLGMLDAIGERFVSLTDVDVHDMHDSHVTKEIYTLEALKYGIRANRKRVHVAIARVVSVSTLDDVVRY